MMDDLIVKNPIRMVENSALKWKLQTPAHCMKARESVKEKTPKSKYKNNEKYLAKSEYSGQQQNGLHAKIEETAPTVAKGNSVMACRG